MRLTTEEKNNGWKVGFAFLPVQIGNTWVWLERYIYRSMGHYTEVNYYEGCAERVGYPCDCFRHVDGATKRDLSKPKSVLKSITITDSLAAICKKEQNGTKITKIVATGEDNMDASDGYHTFTELYDHRITLFIALCRKMNDLYNFRGEGLYPWKSKLHSDGTGYDGWFIMGMNVTPGKQMTYHLPMSRWEETEFAETLSKAPEWDGHTPADVLERIKTL